MNKPKTGLIIVDLLILTLSYIVMASLKPVMVSYLSPRYLIGFGVTLFLWLFSSFYFHKYIRSRRENPRYLLRQVIVPNLVALAFVSFIIYAFNTTFYSRMMVFGTFGLATLVEMVLFSLYTYLIMSPEYDVARAFLEQPPTQADMKHMREAVDHSRKSIDPEIIRNAVVEEVGEAAAYFIDSHVKLGSSDSLVTSTITRFNILRQPDKELQTIVNLKRVNDVRYLNKFFEAVNHKLVSDGTFIGCAETAKMRLQRIIAKYPPIINWLVYTLDYIVKRIFPKFYPTRGLYFMLTRGNNRVLTQAEILGRLYSCGFVMVEEAFVDQLYFFVVRRIKEPFFDPNPSYGPFISLNRVGKDGKLIKVYKLRTMYPFAEYLQDYVHQQNNLEKGGKMKDDFRVARSRSILRKLWIDELPMLINVLKGEIKLVGVRPLSQHYYNLYSEELKEKRIRHKPGLVPPFYADMPETLEEIMASELNYLEAYEKHPLRTQFRYFWRAFYNIVFKKARSA